MERKSFIKRFQYKKELLAFGEEKLLDEFSKVIDNIDDKYIIRTRGMREDFLKLFEFNSKKNLMKQFDKKSISELQKYLPVFVKNIFKSLNNENSFASKCFYSYYGDRDLEIRFELNVWCSLEFTMMSLVKNNGSGWGDSFSFDLINSEKLNNLINEVNSLDIPTSIKKAYIEYFNDESEDNLSIEQAKEYLIESITQEINDYMYDNEKNLRTYKSLKELQFHIDLKEYIDKNKYIGDISDSITLEYYKYKASSYDAIIKHCNEGDLLTNENRLIVKCLDKEIKEIDKSEHTVYEISY